MITEWIGSALGIVDKFIPDKDEAKRLKHEIEKSLIQGELEVQKSQAAINQQEAIHRSIFVAGWRPWVGWICASAFGWKFVLEPVLIFSVVVWTGEQPKLPEIDMAPLLTILLGMLGLGGLRTFEKLKGLTK